MQQSTVLCAAATSQDLASVGSKLARRRACGFVPGNAIWINHFSESLELSSRWRGPGTVLERLEEGMYSWQLHGCYKAVVLHRDRLALERETLDSQRTELCGVVLY